VAQLLRGQGYANIFALRGGFGAWQRADGLIEPTNDAEDR
jgi:rhodanese-related sulfurtransferase